MDFRKTGRTDNAINYPLTKYGQVIMAMHNGVTVEQLPATFRYASNAYMQSWLNRLGDLHAYGFPVKHATGRWLRPEEMEIN